jgi:hypothetical protein
MDIHWLHRFHVHARDEFTIIVEHVHMTQRMIAFPPDEYVAATPDAAHDYVLAGQGIARRKIMGSAVRLTTMTDSLHSHNANHRVKGFASRGLIVLS